MTTVPGGRAVKNGEALNGASQIYARSGPERDPEIVSDEGWNHPIVDVRSDVCFGP